MSAELLMAIALWCGQATIHPDDSQLTQNTKQVSILSCRMSLMSCVQTNPLIKKTIAECFEKRNKSDWDEVIKRIKEESKK